MPERRDGVLITRHAAGAAETAEHVAQLGLRPVIASLLDISRLDFDQPDMPGVQAVLVTSPNAPPVLPATWHRLPLLAVGDATAAAASSAGFTDVRSAAGDATGLARMAAAQCHPASGALLLASGAGQGGALLADLARRGFQVVHRHVYAARPVQRLPPSAQAALAEGTLRAALFFSPATGHAFLAGLDLVLPRGIVEGTDAMVISEATGRVIAPLPWRHIRVASRPNQDELLALLR